MSTTTPCPDPDRLRDFLLGLAPDDEEEGLGRHLAECPGCCERGARLGRNDRLAAAVRAQAAADRDPIEEAAVALLVRKVQQSPSRPATAPAEGAAREALDFLAAPERPDEIGRLGPYRVLEVLGRGGMGVVFKAEQPGLGRLVALKVMRPSLAAHADARERFVREARAAAAVRHERVVTIHDVGEDRGVPYIGMELLHGETLEDRLRRDGRLPPAEVLRVGREVAEGLAAAHASGLIHRDVKPGNVWLEGETGRVKLLDFGLVRAAGTGPHLTQSGVILGTPAYMAPEQARGRPVDARADLFSLGSLLYRAATGRPAFTGPDAPSVLLAVASERPPAPHRVNPAVPRTLSDLVVRLLEKDPDRRPASAGEVAAAVREIEAGAARRPAPPRPPWGYAVAAAAVLLAAAVTWAVTVRLQTPDGTLAVVLEEPDAAVTADGNQRLVIDSPKAGRIELEAKGGRLTLRRGQEELGTGNFTLKQGGAELLRVTWARSGDGASPPAPFDLLDANDVPAGDRPKWPAEAVAVWNDLPPAPGLKVSDLAVAPSGRFVLWAAAETVAGREPETGWKAAFKVQKAAPESGVDRVAVAPDGRSFVRGGWHIPVALCDVATGERRASFGGEQDVVLALAFTPDGRHVLTSHRDYSDGPATLRLWDAKTGQEVRRFKGHTKYAYGLAVSPDGTRIVSGGLDRTLRLWDLRTGAQLDLTEFPCGSVAWSPDGRQIAVASVNDVHLFDPAGDKLRAGKVLAGHGDGIYTVAFSPDGRLLASGGIDRRIIVWDAAAGKQVREMRLPDVVTKVGFTPDGRHVVAGVGGELLVLRLAAAGRKVLE